MSNPAPALDPVDKFFDDVVRDTIKANVGSERARDAVAELLRDQAKLVIDLRSCARCGSDHQQLTFSPFTFPVLVPGDFGQLTHWAACPTNGEPILVQMISPL